MFSPRKLDTEANKFYDRAHRLRDSTNLISYIGHLGILSNLNLSTKGSNPKTYPLYLKILLLFLFEKRDPIHIIHTHYIKTVMCPF